MREMADRQFGLSICRKIQETVVHSHFYSLRSVQEEKHRMRLCSKRIKISNEFRTFGSGPSLDSTFAHQNWQQSYLTYKEHRIVTLKPEGHIGLVRDIVTLRSWHQVGNSVTANSKAWSVVTVTMLLDSAGWWCNIPELAPNL